MLSESSRAALLQGMRSCNQMPGMTILDHGELVADYFEDLARHIRMGTPLEKEWRLPDWVVDPLLWRSLPSDTDMAAYHVFHDCGKPLCRTIDDEGRQHFPDHAAASKAAWLAAGGDTDVGELIGMDMDVHVLKGDEVEAFAQRPQAAALLLTALAEIHANAAMFGGVGSTSFKIKWKHVDKRGRAIVRQLLLQRFEKEGLSS